MYVSKLDSALKQLDTIMKKRVIRVVSRYERNLQELMRLGKSGHIYRRGTIEHQASAPDEAPAVDTGMYSQNITHDIVRRGYGEYAGKVGTTKAIPEGQVMALELGKLDGSLKPRPMWVVAARMLRKQLKQLLEQS